MNQVYRSDEKMVKLYSDTATDCTAKVMCEKGEPLLIQLDGESGTVKISGGTLPI